MINVNLRTPKDDEILQKNVLYKINETCVIPFIESHGDQKKEIVKLEYNIGEHQYGIYAHEYRSPVAAKEGSKMADVLACVVDELKARV